MCAERISVVVPAYNNAPWMERSLDSLLAQTYQNLEIIAVNDGSTDDTGKVLEEYAGKYEWIRVFHKENGGVTSARLLGAAQATGDWIGFMDGDDWVEPQMYERLLENACRYGADISHCGHQVVFDDGRISYVHNSGKLRQQDHKTGLGDLLDGREVDARLCTKLFRKKLFSGLADWMDPAIKNNEDLLMNYYLFSRAEKAVFEDVCPYHYILRQGSASHRQFNEHSLFDPIRVRQMILQRCSPEMREEARSSLLRYMLFVYAQTVTHLERQYDDYRKRARELLLEQREYFSLLSKRNRLLANMICMAPWSFRLAYGLYVALFQREEQH